MNCNLRWFTAIALVLCAVFPGTQSIWIDENETWRIAILPSVHAVWSELTVNRNSEALMPWGMLNAWAALRVFGSSEWELRAVNILWSAAAVFAFAAIGRRWRTPWAPLLFALQPFVWYYGNEARPYSMQMACSALLLLGVVTALDEQRITPRILLLLLASGGVLIGTTLFGILTVLPAYAAVGWLAWRQRWSLPPRWKMCLLLWLGYAGSLGVYFLLALKRGAGGAKLWDVGIQNVAFALYEFAGFSGFGPGRAELREAASSGGPAAALGVLGLSLLPMALLGIAYADFLLVLWRRTLASPARTTALVLAAVAGSSAVVLIALALVARFPFWGRHLAPVFPFFCALLVLALRDATARSSAAVAKAAMAVILALLASSSLLLRFSSRHARDDYRGAVALARQLAAETSPVWWAADIRTPSYYGLKFEDRAALDGRLQHVTGLSSEALAALPPPAVIVVSKPDVYDPGSTVTAYLEAKGFILQHRLKAFRVFARP